jgi:hypothetical protein
VQQYACVPTCVEVGVEASTALPGGLKHHPAWQQGQRASEAAAHIPQMLVQLNELWLCRVSAKQSVLQLSGNRMCNEQLPSHIIQAMLGQACYEEEIGLKTYHICRHGLLHGN